MKLIFEIQKFIFQPCSALDVFLSTDLCIDIEVSSPVYLFFQICPGDTSLRMLQKLQELVSETAHVPERLPDRVIFTNMFSDITANASRKGARGVSGQRERRGRLCSRRRTWLLVFFCGPGSGQTRTDNDRDMTSKKGKPGAHSKNEPQNNVMLVKWYLRAINFVCFSQ